MVKKIKSRVKWSPAPPFGISADFDIPDDCDVVVLCVDAMQIKPLHVLLPHQIYKHDLKALAKEHGSDKFFVIPYRSKDVIDFKRPKR